MPNHSHRILAVSGGVDSVVMLDLLARIFPRNELIIAHFDHGTRGNSHEDAAFVEHLAERYGIEYIIGNAQLGPHTSEAEARGARYGFLRGLGGTIYTAHHLDDLVESIAINLLRGTGWRGLAPLSAPDVVRPFLDQKILPGAPFSKSDLLRYAGEHNLIFREDPTNSSPEYMRNRLRENIHESNHELLPDIRIKLYKAWQKQLSLKTSIDELTDVILQEQRNGTSYSRENFIKLDDAVSLELLRKILQQHGLSATRPQMLDFLDAIRTYLPGKYFNLPGDHLVRIEKTNFSL